MKDVFKKLEHLAAGKVLDAATGKGEFIKVIQQHFQSYQQIIGIDQSEVSVKQAQKLFPDNDIEIYKMNLESLTFADGYFDTVCISNSLHHLHHADKVFAELLRVLKPGGLLVIVEMYQDGTQTEAQHTHIMMHHWISSIDRLHGNYHRETFTREQIRQFALSLPLTEVEIAEFSAPVDNPQDPKEIEPLVHNVQEWMKRCEALPEAENICPLGHQIIDRMRTLGCMTASKLLITARKK
jgi:ubiquinone/menaquinone biosynthesis C-methylase UbiE